MLKIPSTWLQKYSSIWIIKKAIDPYKYILTNPGEGSISMNSPNNSKCYAERRNSQGQVRHSSKERYFGVWIPEIFEPSVEMDK